MLAVALPSTIALGDGGAWLSVSSDPPGAAVSLDGESLGTTPTGPCAVSTNAHSLRVAKPGFLEDSRTLEMAEGALRHVHVELRAKQPARAGEGFSPSRKAIALALGGAAATVAGITLLPSSSSAATTNSPPTLATGATVNPNKIGFAGVTHFVFSAGGWTDEDGDSLTFTWDLGDGTQLSGHTVAHTYQSEGIYAATFRVSDGRDERSGGLRVTLKDVSGRWVPDGDGYFRYGRIELVQEGSAIRGALLERETGAELASIGGHALPPRYVSLVTQWRAGGQSWLTGQVAENFASIQFDGWSLKRE